MGAVKAMAKLRTGSRPREYKDKSNEPRYLTMHDGDYRRVFKAIERARAEILPGQTHKDFRCPVCNGLATAFAIPREQNNMDKAMVAMCQNRCFECWE